MNNRTKIIVGIIVAVIAVFGISVMFFQRAQAPGAVDIGKSVPKGWMTYNDISSGLSLKAPIGLTLASNSVGLSLIFPTTTPYANTHLLHEIQIDIDMPQPKCVSTYEGPIGPATVVKVGDLTFERVKWSSVGAGNIYQGIEYTTVLGDLCHRIALFTHSTNGEGFYTNNKAQISKINAIQAVDINALFDLFDQIARTIKITK